MVIVTNHTRIALNSYVTGSNDFSGKDRLLKSNNMPCLNLVKAV